MESSEAVKVLVNCQRLPSSSSSLKLNMKEMTVNRVMVLVALRAMVLVALGEILQSLQMVLGKSLNKFLGRTGLRIESSNGTFVGGDGVALRRLTWRGEEPCGGMEHVFGFQTPGSCW